MTKPIVDIHIHIAAKDRPDCIVSPTMLSSPAFLYMLAGNGIDPLELAEDFDGTIRRTVLGALESSESVDRGVVLALDGIYRGGDLQESHLVVSNDYVQELARNNPRILFGASVNPMRTDAREELEKCLAGDPPAALIKWIPNSQLIDPIEPANDWFYERIAEENTPLLCHTGPEYAVPVPGGEENQRRGDPRLLERALDVGITVIAAHCAARFFPLEEHDFHDAWLQ